MDIQGWEAIKELLERTPDMPELFKFESEALLSLVNQEIARLSKTEEEIKIALDYVHDWKFEALQYDESVGIFPPYNEEVNAWETIEIALNQMKTKNQEDCDQCKEYQLDFYFCPNCGKENNNASD